MEGAHKLRKFERYSEEGRFLQHAADLQQQTLEWRLQTLEALSTCKIKMSEMFKMHQPTAPCYSCTSISIHCYIYNVLRLWWHWINVWYCILCAGEYSSALNVLAQITTECAENEGRLSSPFNLLCQLNSLDLSFILHVGPYRLLKEQSEISQFLLLTLLQVFYYVPQKLIRQLCKHYGPLLCCCYFIGSLLPGFKSLKLHHTHLQPSERNAGTMICSL